MGVLEGCEWVGWQGDIEVSVRARGVAEKEGAENCGSGFHVRAKKEMQGDENDMGRTEKLVAKADGESAEVKEAKEHQEMRRATHVLGMDSISFASDSRASARGMSRPQHAHFLHLRQRARSRIADGRLCAAAFSSQWRAKRPTFGAVRGSLSGQYR